MIAEAKALVMSKDIEEVREINQTQDEPQVTVRTKTIPFKSMIALKNYEEIERL